MRMFRGWSWQTRAMVCCVVLCLGGNGIGAQSKGGGTRKSVAPAWMEHDCGQGVRLRLSAAEANQGSLVLVEVSSAEALSEVKGEWNGNAIPVWPERAKEKQTRDEWRGMLGIDLEHELGKYDFSITVMRSEGAPLSCSASVIVKDGRFATEKLSVAPQFVEPNPEQLARAQEESKRLHEIYATVTPEKLWNGRFRIPLTGAKTGGNFGKRRVLNGEPSSPHSGVDFPAPTGTPVHAAQRGRVVLAEPLYFSGNTVVVDHGLGVYTFYGHLSAIGVKVGDSVEAVAVLGKVGATGRVTGPHLHWGLEVNRARVNALDITKIQSLGMRVN
jgi:murein DD-endopeptidase MepM/ murein hydrolase activator NlpD